jgi:hypothetical protein
LNSSVIKIPNVICVVIALNVEHLKNYIRGLVSIIGQTLGSVNLQAFSLLDVEFKVAMFESIPPINTWYSIVEWNRFNLGEFNHFHL